MRDGHRSNRPPLNENYVLRLFISRMERTNSAPINRQPNHTAPMKNPFQNSIIARSASFALSELLLLEPCFRLPSNDYQFPKLLVGGLQLFHIQNSDVSRHLDNQLVSYLHFSPLISAKLRLLRRIDPGPILLFISFPRLSQYYSSRVFRVCPLVFNSPCCKTVVALNLFLTRIHD